MLARVSRTLFRPAELRSLGGPATSGSGSCKGKAPKGSTPREVPVRSAARYT